MNTICELSGGMTFSSVISNDDKEGFCLPLIVYLDIGDCIYLWISHYVEYVMFRVSFACRGFRLRMPTLFVKVGGRPALHPGQPPLAHHLSGLSARLGNLVSHHGR